MGNTILFWLIKIAVPLLLVVLLIYLLPVIFYCLYEIFYLIKVSVFSCIFRFIPEKKQAEYLFKLIVNSVPPRKNFSLIEAVQKDLFLKIIGSSTADILTKASKDSEGEEIKKAYEKKAFALMKCLLDSAGDTLTYEDRSKLAQQCAVFLVNRDSNDLIEKIINESNKDLEKNKGIPRI